LSRDVASLLIFLQYCGYVRYLNITLICYANKAANFKYGGTRVI